jgi:hypothetical protein
MLINILFQLIDSKEIYQILKKSNTENKPEKVYY